MSEYTEKDIVNSEDDNSRSSVDRVGNISRPDVSPAVVKRLPKYFRYLRQLIRQGKTRVSSAELSKMMNFTASVIIAAGKRTTRKEIGEAR